MLAFKRFEPRQNVIERFKGFLTFKILETLKIDFHDEF
jgi:hypothetical protein